MGRYMTRQEALKIAQDIQKNFQGWAEYLPDCPLLAPEDDPVWDDASGFTSRINCFHPEAASCFRSARGYFSPYGKEHCQQCCYDSNKKLITSGTGAGTPDFQCSGSMPNSDHCYYDTMTWTALGWEEYNKFWKPNRGMVPALGNRRYVETGVSVKRGEIIDFTTDPRYRVEWGEQLNGAGLPVARLESGPEGEIVTPESDVMNQLLTLTLQNASPRDDSLGMPILNAPYAALIGYVRRADGRLTEPFLIGAERVLDMPEDGQLVLGINDPVVKDNEGSYAVSIRRCPRERCR